jgi:pimeloyl-ACP methyl ester carboxylesterase
LQDVTDALVAALDRRGVERFHYAGVSISGCVGLDLGLRYPERLATVAVISAGARVDDPPLMRERAAIAREQGVGTFVEPFRERWFAPTTSSVTTERILGILERTDALSYGYAAEALADFDVWDLLSHIDTPLLAVGGEQDRSVPVERSFELATKVPRGIAISMPNAAHTVVAERPDAVSQALGEFIERNRSRSRP